MPTLSALLYVVLIAIRRDGHSKPLPVPLPVPYHRQFKGNWCWAACGEMMMDYLGKDVPQCQQVTDAKVRRRHFTDCCLPGTGCNVTGFPNFRRYGLAADAVDHALSWRRLTREIGRHGRPVAFSYYDGSGGSHMCVADGSVSYSLGGVQHRRVHVQNPRDSSYVTWLEYEEYVVGTYGAGHFRDIFRVGGRPGR